MLTLKKMSWSNCFSYGENNILEFDKNPLTQLVGSNGAGKTSISLLIQEILYGKNNKNIKKQDITNNKSGVKGYWITLWFSKNGNEYRVELDRKSNLKFKLYENDVDISSHTSLNTYKTLADIIGIADFKIFCQLIYQHSTDSLDFLTATDTNRKKFLISLLQLDRYIELHEVFKTKVRDSGLKITSLEGSINTIESWINKHQDMDFIKRELLEVPEVNDYLPSRIEKLRADIANINSINKKIVTNCDYKEQLEKLDSKYYMGSAPNPPSRSSAELQVELGVLQSAREQHARKLTQLRKTKGQCPTCLQEVNEKERTLMIDAERIEQRRVEKNIEKVKAERLQSELIEREISRYNKEKATFERLNQLIDKSIPFKTLDLRELKDELLELETEYKLNQNEIKRIEVENMKISAHNSKIDVIKSQLDDMKKELAEKNVSLVEEENLNNILELLKKTFGTNGLVSYKIESSVKELEKKINEYLSELTHFQIYFKLAGEKLNIEVLDDVGNIFSISNLSSGERARVNIATILAIRSILSSLTNTKINLLFLDEVIGVIDAEGKEKLSEILLQESLNTFIVSHDWNHPLIPRINIVKEHHISRIEND